MNSPSPFGIDVVPRGLGRIARKKAEETWDDLRRKRWYLSPFRSHLL